MHNALSGPNPLPAECLSAQERLDEVASILASGLRRIQAQEASSLSAENRESSLTFSPSSAVLVVANQPFASEKVDGSTQEET
jgi:hypothetical protein